MIESLVKGIWDEFSSSAKTRCEPARKDAVLLNVKRRATRLLKRVRSVHKTYETVLLDRKMVLPCSGRGTLANKDQPAYHTALRLLSPLVPRVTLVSVARLAQQRASGALVRSRGEWLSLFTY